MTIDYMEENIIIEGEYMGCMFEAYYDNNYHVLHVLDAMGEEEGIRSLTNTVDQLIPKLEKEMHLHRAHQVFLYGTDKVIAEYFTFDGSFRFVPKSRNSVLSFFRDRMESMY